MANVIFQCIKGIATTHYQEKSTNIRYVEQTKDEFFHFFYDRFKTVFYSISCIIQSVDLILDAQKIRKIQISCFLKCVLKNLFAKNSFLIVVLLQHKNSFYAKQDHPFLQNQNLLFLIFTNFTQFNFLLPLDRCHIIFTWY